MNTYLAIASKRDTRRFADKPVDQATVARILQAGRVSGSARNRQPWQLLVIGDDLWAELGEVVTRPSNLVTARLMVGLAKNSEVSTADFDLGRAAQNMMLAAWDSGLDSCPNGIADRERGERLLGVTDPYVLQTILTFGVPSRPRDPESRDAAVWVDEADRLPLEQIARHVGAKPPSRVEI